MTRPSAWSEDPPSQALENAAAAFAMLSSSVRLHIVWTLAQQDSDVSHLAQRVGSTPQAVSQHLAKLKLAGIVRVRREGRNHIYSVTDHSLHAVATLMIERFTLKPERPLLVGHQVSV
ncbi:metalloregulator ArsR/SmtB family transcription factor [Streptomyces sp. RB6PN25]|uniref:Metalloregulator ArsR/SmtB family transcription factor n=1 Tax=Streptomyces humicola TaxID=2953240 RepID=A0ABT1Q1Y1_9ACTN|nr:metalloregulator ArsR/SmtB family transcription factor [Streptomyces humicola]MCQ4083936.1 metalloregulator ArsR/SmtB family transcription factor [Streptomyces humicola]